MWQAGWICYVSIPLQLSHNNNKFTMIIALSEKKPSIDTI